MARAILCLLATLDLAGAGRDQPLFRGGVDLAMFGVTVLDRRGNLVTDLRRDEFHVSEDGRPQQIEHFAPAAGEGDDAALASLHPGLLLDTSQSMEDDLALARTAAIKFLNLLPASEDITLVDFDSEVRVTRYPQRDFARIVERIRGRRASGETALYDALGVYLDGASGQAGRPVLVIYSDGVDSRSSLSFKEVVDLLKASNATVYAIGLLDNTGSARLDARMRLQMMAELTGGTALFPSSARTLDGFYAQVLREIRAQYQLGYLSTNAAADGRWRTVEVKVSRPGVTVRTRKGYFAAYKPGPRR
jgi:Ca-activated chloride channel family protein